MAMGAAAGFLRRFVGFIHFTTEQWRTAGDSRVLRGFSPNHGQPRNSRKFDLVFGAFGRNSVSVTEF